MFLVDEGKEFLKSIAFMSVLFDSGFNTCESISNLFCGGFLPKNINITSFIYESSDVLTQCFLLIVLLVYICKNKAL